MSQSDKTTIALFNYGGGMRGLIPAHLMAKLEKATGLRMADMVDIFAGPSTGAILNAALNVPHPDKPGRPKYKARHLVKFYEHEGLKIFPPDGFRSFRGILHDFNNRTLKLGQLNNLLRHGHYNPENLRKPLKALYGDSYLADSLRTLIVPTYNIDGEQLALAEEADDTADSPARTKNNFVDHGGHAVWLKNIRHGYPARADFKTPGVKLYDAVMASCAAPTYFPCHHFNVTYQDRRGTMAYSGIDGVIFDNPCISYMGAIRNLVPPDHKLIMIVLGTGYTNKSITKEDWNRLGALGVVDPVNDLPLINIFFHASESALLETFETEMGDNLFVFNKSMLDKAWEDEILPSPQIDDASPENLERLSGFADAIVEENRGKFDGLCDILTHHRDRREQTARRSLVDKARKVYFSLRGNGRRKSD